MTTDPLPERGRGPGVLARLYDLYATWRNRRIADPAFQAWATGFPLTRGIANRQGAQLYDLVAGFVYSQVLQACVELDLFRLLRDKPLEPEVISGRTGLPVDGIVRLAQAATALGLLERRGAGRFGLGTLGAAVLVGAVLLTGIWTIFHQLWEVHPN